MANERQRITNCRTILLEALAQHADMARAGGHNSSSCILGINAQILEKAVEALESE